MSDERYKVQEIDGAFYVVDMKHPDNPAPVYARRKDAEHDARVWNLLLIKKL